MKITEIKCEKCGKLFIAYKSSNRRYCSQTCANRVSISNKSRMADRTELICKGCGKGFYLLTATIKTREKSSGKKVLYCSMECYRNARVKQKKICLACGNSFEAQRSRQKYCSVDCKRHAQLGKSKTGFWYENGYRVLYAGNGKGIKEHIKIVEDRIGRKLNKNEIVHHKDFVPTNNNPDNLDLMTVSEHSKLHREHEKEAGKLLFGGASGYQGKSRRTK